jgi:hypothetical protein
MQRGHREDYPDPVARLKAHLLQAHLRRDAATGEQKQDDPLCKGHGDGIRCIAEPFEGAYSCF